MPRKQRERSRANGEPEGGGMNGTAPNTLRQARLETVRGRIVEAFLELVAERPIEAVDLPDIAARAGVSLAELRGEFGSKLAILAQHVKDIDREVLAGDRADMAEEPPRERLFDVLMRRLDALSPYRDAVRSLLRSARSNPGLACALNSLAVRSQTWMLAAADIPAAGPSGMVRAQGMAILYARVLGTFVDDDEPDHARTMAALDRALSRGQWWAGMLDGACRLMPGCGPRRRARAATRADDGEPVAI